jgi:hypothetical protein
MYSESLVMRTLVSLIWFSYNTKNYKVQLQGEPDHSLSEPFRKNTNEHECFIVCHRRQQPGIRIITIDNDMYE